MVYLSHCHEPVPFRNFSLSLSYSFGKLKENVSKKKGIKNDDEVQQ